MSSTHLLLMWVVFRAFCFSIGPTPARESVLSTDPELEKLPSDLFGEGLCTVCSASYKRLKLEDISSGMYQ